MALELAIKNKVEVEYAEQAENLRRRMESLER